MDINKVSDVKVPQSVEARLSATPQKAKPVQPPEGFLPKEEPLSESLTSAGVVEVNMTRYFAANIALSAATLGLTAATTYLWRKVRKQDEHMEAVREYVSRLINETSCGRNAYVTFLEDEGLEDDTVNWSNESEPVDEDDLAEKIDQ